MIAPSDQELRRKYLADPAASNWFKDALRLALERDPVDALNDCEVLAKILRERLEEMMAGLEVEMRRNGA